MCKVIGMLQMLMLARSHKHFIASALYVQNKFNKFFASISVIEMGL